MESGANEKCPKGNVVTNGQNEKWLKLGGQNEEWL